ncbi:MAG TPA: 2-C-methyl-D-erythritol 4-phosphate cytidylyltransferase [Thermoanaerobaculia bacterium]
MRILVVIPAAGSGTRFGGDIPKQFRPLQGKPVLQHVVERFLVHEDVARIMVAVTEKLLTVVAQNESDRVRFTAGGETRLDSVMSAFTAAGDDGYDIVAVHDAVRPFFFDATFIEAVSTAAEFGAAMPGIPIIDTLHAVRNEFIDTTFDVSSLVLAQTPQCFRYEVLRDVLYKAAAEHERGTDEAGLAARFGVKVKLIPGDPMNFKITHPDDLAVAEAIMARWGQQGAQP